MITVGIIGARGYAGKELIRYLLRHSKVEITKLWAKEISAAGEDISDICPEYKNSLRIKVRPFRKKEVRGLDVLFLALPHKVSMKIVPEVIDDAGLIIDLAADYRFRDYKTFQNCYGTKHSDRKNIKNSVYGLPEIIRDKIKNARLIANPGCYPTGVILGLYPLLKEKMEILKSAVIVIDSKSGTSGAGRKKEPELLFTELSGNIRPYKINSHQHMPEITSFMKEQFGCAPGFNFIPQILPFSRGIMNMIYIDFKNKPRSDIYSLYKNCYSKERFVRIYSRGKSIELKPVLHSNYCDLGFLDYLSKSTFLIISCIDNLGKGAAGQAVQNMNVALGLHESEGLL